MEAESKQPSEGRATVIVWLMFALCFLPYPLALLTPTRMGIDFRYDLAFPVQLWATVIALVGFTRLQLPPAAQSGTGTRSHAVWRFFQTPSVRVLAGWCLLLAAFLLILDWRLSGARLAEIAHYAGLFAIPLYLMLAPDQRIPKAVGAPIAVLWLVHAVHGLQQFAVGWEVLGVTGNRNWTAALLVSTAPWAWQTAVRRRQGKSIRITWGVIVGAITAFLAFHASSRAVWMVAGAYAVLFLALGRGPRWRRLTILTLVTILFGCALAIKAKPIARSLANDVRGPMWFSTLEMISDRPLTGVSPGAFTKRFLDYRSPIQMRSPKAAPVTIHPHNQVLYIAATGGLPLAILWAVLALSVLRPPGEDERARLIHFTAFILIACGMLDLTVFMQPTALLALIMLGLHLRSSADCRLEAAGAVCGLPAVNPPASGARSCFPCPLLKGAVIVMLVLLAGYHTGESLRYGWNLRQANIAEARNDYDKAFRNYLQAHAAMPSEPEALYAASEIALVKLRNPEVALEHGREVQRLSPSYAHVNGLMATAFERTGNAEAALEHFLREARLFPYDVVIQATALDRFLRARLSGPALDTRRRLAAARWHHLVKQVGEIEAVQLRDRLHQAISEGRLDEAVTLANKVLLAMPPQPWSEPAGRKLQRSAKLGGTSGKGPFAGEECAYWSQAVSAADLPRPTDDAGALAIPEIARSVLNRSLEGSRQHSPFTIAEDFRLAGWMSAVVEVAPGTRSSLIEVRWGNWTALLIPPDQIIEGFCGADLLVPERVEAMELTIDKQPERIVYNVPVRVADLWTRNQIIGDVLRKGRSTGTPVLGESPTLYVQLYRALSLGDETTPDDRVSWEPRFR